MSLKRIGKAAALDKSKWLDFLINGGIVILSAALTYVTDNITKLDLGQFGPIITAGVALVLKYVQKWVEGLNKKEVDPEPTPPNNPDFPIK